MRDEWTDWTFDTKGHYTSDEHMDLAMAQYNKQEAFKRLYAQVVTQGTLFAERRERNARLAESEDPEVKALLKDIKAIDSTRFAEFVGDDDHLINVKPSCLNQCGHCGGEVGFTINTKTKVATAQSECKTPGGMSEYSVAFDVPSGKLVFANDLREFYPNAGDYNVNHDSGTKRTSESYAAQGMFHFFLGNTCPGLYQSGNTISIGSPRPNMDDDEEGYEEAYEVLSKENERGENVGGICTDLWWYSAADYDDLKQRFEEAGEDFDKFINGSYVDVVNVEPGHYRAVGRNHVLRREQYRVDLAFSDVWRLQQALRPAERKKAKEEIKKSHYYSYNGWVELAQLPPKELRPMLEEAKRVHAAEKAKLPTFELRSYIERVSDCTGVNLHALAEAKNQVTPSFEDYVKLCRLSYPGIFPTRARVLDHIFLTIGNGLDWRDGALYSISERDEASRERLEAGEKVTFESDKDPDSFYPMSDDYSGVFTVPDDVRHDWLAGAFEILNIVIRSDPNHVTSTGRTNADNIKMARKAYERLHKQFDDDHDAYHPVFCYLQSRSDYPTVVKANLDAGWEPEPREEAKARAKSRAKEREKARALAAAKKKKTKKKATKKKVTKKKATKKKAKRKAR